MDDEPRRRPEPWPLAIAALLAAMIGTSVGFYRVAAAHPDGLVTDDAFAAGIAFADARRAEERARALGWTLDVAAEPRGGTVHVVARLRDRDGAALPVDAITLRRERPAEGGLDAELALAAQGDAYEGSVALPRPGRWQLVVAARRAQARVERRLALTAP
jgi:nitrogen fixation protein FixH